MTDKESKQSKEESPKKEVSASESNQKNTTDMEISNMNSSYAHNTYAQLICREDNKNKKSNALPIQEMKDISELRRYRKGETTYDNPPPEPITRKKLFAIPKDLVKKKFRWLQRRRFTKRKIFIWEKKI